MSDTIIINGKPVPRPARLPLKMGDRVKLRDGYTTEIRDDDGSGVPWLFVLLNGERYWKNASGISPNSSTDIMEILTPKPDYPMPADEPQVGEVWTMEVKILGMVDEVFEGQKRVTVEFVDGKREWINRRLLKSRVSAAAPKVEVKPGMLIRGLRGFTPQTATVDTVLSVEGREIRVSTPDLGGGTVNQRLVHPVEVRWPWEPESAWRRVTP